MNRLHKLYYRIFYKDVEFDEFDSSYYGFFSNGERLHGIILGHNPIRVTNQPERNCGIYMCNGCKKEYNQTWTAESLVK
ncbi:hypothetical protein LCGC14_0372160 [marine sediment metagenome]|uniref:Uncharacterized protein n=1 Tax=marine sediment metagenome TaxID=412755 RepID=A0A0F9T4Q7_9ZZZZ